MDWIFPLIGGLGVGALLKSVVEFIFNKNITRQKVEYSEAREAYLGLLDALHKAAVEPSDKHSKDFALWQTRIQLFGSEKVAKAVQGIIDTNADSQTERNKFFEEMIDAMKEDLHRKSA